MSEPAPGGEAWDKVATILRRSVPRQQFETWFRGMRLLSLSPERAELTVPNNFLREWIHRKYFGVLRRALREVSAGDPEIEIRIADDGTGAGTSTQVPAADAAGEPPASAAPEPRALTYGESDVVLNSLYNFDNFVPGPSNNFGYAASLAVADSPGKSYNPLFLHGSVGLGKTHLLQAICHRLMDRRPDMRILYLSCETFTNHFVTAVANGELDSFRFRYRHVDVLLIDDIHFLANRERTQEEFFHTFNTLYNANKQIILSSDSNPAEIPTLEERLVSRFKWGIVARIDQPVYETRVAIIARKVRMHGVDFPDEVVRFLAENVRSNIRELEGAVNKVAGMAHIYSRPVDMDMARETLRDLIPPSSVRVSIDGIIRTVAEYYGVPVRDLMGKRRTKSIAYPRQICMFLARRLTSHSLEEIGGYFGGRDHTTVMYAYDKIRREVEADGDLSRTLELLKSKITT
ncbi:MAG: chromosomal replication initiator protein DnaA [Planctomycetota bacterium]|jgi:chromosomal replication initiator protein